LTPLPLKNPNDKKRDPPYTLKKKHESNCDAENHEMLFCETTNGQLIEIIRRNSFARAS
jgi:hypothetical protein